MIELWVNLVLWALQPFLKLLCFFLCGSDSCLVFCLVLSLAATIASFVHLVVTGETLEESE